MKKELIGRPPNNEKKKQINIYLSNETYETIKEMADKNSRSLSNMAEVLIETQIESKTPNV